MDTIDRSTTELIISGDAERFVYDEKRKAIDPEPWIKPATMERFAEEQPGVFCVYLPRIVWPEHGGRMVRRDYLRPGDRAFSSYYGARTVEAVRVGGAEGQTTTISWIDAPRSEAYPSEAMIELLPEVR